MSAETTSLARLITGIEASRDQLLALLQSLDRQAANTPIAEGRWAPVQYLEHLVRAEEATVWRMWTAVEAERAGEPGVRSTTPGETIEEVAARTWGETVEAPPLALPSLGGSLAYWMIRMRRNAELVAAFAAFVADDELDTVAYAHPISGPFTMRQAFEFLRFHMDRHRGHLASTLVDGEDADGSDSENQ